MNAFLKSGWAALALALSLVALARPASAVGSVEQGKVFRASYEAEAAGKIDEAYRLINEGIPASENNYAAVMRLAYLKSLLAKYQEAAQGYARAGQLEPRALEPVLYEQYQYLVLADWAGLERAAREGLKRDPNSYYSLARLGYALYSLGRYPDAAEQYTKVATLYPLDLDALVMRGWSYALASRKPQAQQAFQKVLAISPDNQSALEGLTFCEKLQ